MTSDLKALSDAATQGEWREAGGDAILTGRNGGMIVIGSLHADHNDPPFVANLVNDYRAGKLVEVDQANTSAQGCAAGGC